MARTRLLGLLICASLAVANAGAIAQNTDKDVLIYLDRSGTVVDHKESEPPSKFLAEMLEALLISTPNGLRLIGDQDRIVLSNFGDAGEFEQMSVVNGSSVSELSAELAKFKNPKAQSFDGRSKTHFADLFARIREDLAQYNGRPRLVLIASDFVPDPYNNPCGVQQILHPKVPIPTNGRTSGAADFKGRYLPEQVESLNALAEAISDNDETFVALFVVKPDSTDPATGSKSWYQCFVNIRDRIDQPNGLLDQMRKAIGDDVLEVVPYESYASRGLNEFIRNFIGRLRERFEGPSLKIEAADQRFEDSAWSFEATFSGAPEQDFLVDRIMVRDGDGEERTLTIAPGSTASTFDVTGTIPLADFDTAEARSRLEIVASWRWDENDQSRSNQPILIGDFAPNEPKLGNFEYINLRWDGSLREYTLKLKAIGDEIGEQDLAIAILDRDRNEIEPETRFDRESLTLTITLSQEQSQRILGQERISVVPLQGQNRSRGDQKYIQNLPAPTKLTFSDVDVEASPDNQGRLGVAFDVRADETTDARPRRLAGFIFDAGRHGCVEVPLEGGARVFNPGESVQRARINLDLTHIQTGIGWPKNHGGKLFIHETDDLTGSKSGACSDTPDSAAELVIQIDGDLFDVQVTSFTANVGDGTIDVLVTTPGNEPEVEAFRLSERDPDQLLQVRMCEPPARQDEGPFLYRNCEVSEKVFDDWLQTGSASIAPIIRGEPANTISRERFKSGIVASYKIELFASRRFALPFKGTKDGIANFIVPVSVRGHGLDELKTAQEYPITLTFKVGEKALEATSQYDEVRLRVDPFAEEKFSFVPVIAGVPNEAVTYIDFEVSPKNGDITRAEWKNTEFIAKAEISGRETEIGETFFQCRSSIGCSFVAEFFTMASASRIYLMLGILFFLIYATRKSLYDGWNTFDPIIFFRNLFEKLDLASRIASFLGLTTIGLAILEYFGFGFPEVLGNLIWYSLFAICVILAAFAAWNSRSLTSEAYRQFKLQIPVMINSDGLEMLDYNRAVQGARKRQFVICTFVSGTIFILLLIISPRNLIHFNIFSLFNF